LESRAQTLERLQLLRKPQPPDEPLRTLCHHGYLSGGLSIALDVKIDEALGPLLETMGGAALMLRVLDIRGKVFSVKLSEQQHEWEIDGLESLIDTLNRGFGAAPDVKALVLLGEWEDMIQVWAVPKGLVEQLLPLEWFKPSNPPGLKAALGRGRSSSS
jgi:hypothetical protein